MSTTSLNQGFELDTIQQNPGHELDKALFENIVPGEIPTMKKDAAAETVVHKDDNLNTVKEAEHSDHGGSFATTLEALGANIDLLDGRYDDIEYLRQDIFANRGMNQRLAMECEELLPGFLSVDRPIGFFTTQTTKTQYTASLEFLEDGKSAVMQAVMVALQELIARVTAWYREYQKERESAAVTLDVRRMYFISQNGADVAQVLKDRFKFFNTQDFDAQLQSRQGQLKEGSEDWFDLHTTRMRAKPWNVKDFVEHRPNVLTLFANKDLYSLLAGHIEQATKLQNQLVNMINANAESGVVALLDGSEFKRISTFIDELTHARLMSSHHELGEFQVSDLVATISSLFPSLVNIQGNLDERLSMMERMAKALEKAKVDFTATNHNSEGLTRLKSAQITLGKLLGFERSFEAGMRVLTQYVVQSASEYKRDLDRLMEKAAAASNNTATLGDVLDYKLVERVTQRLEAIQ